MKGFKVIYVQYNCYRKFTLFNKLILKPKKRIKMYMIKKPTIEILILLYMPLF